MKSNLKHLKNTLLTLLIVLIGSITVFGQLLKLPDAGTNFKCMAGRIIGNTEIGIHWNAPGVKDRAGQIWGTPVAYYGFSVLGFGSYAESPWRAGADESTTISFSTDVKINGKDLPAGKYGFFIALYPDSCVLIFNKNSGGWGSYFYNKDLDVLRVTTFQQKDIPTLTERLNYTFSDQTQNAVTICLEWEKWKIPMKVEIDLVKTTLSSIRSQMSGAMGFDPPSMESAAFWCYTNEVNLDQALSWINTAVDPSFGAIKTFKALALKSGILKKLGKFKEANQAMIQAMSFATAMDMHQYGRQLLAEKNIDEAFKVFEKNLNDQKGAWPTNAGMMRAYSAKGDLKKALEYAKKAMLQAPNIESKKALEISIKTLESGKFL